MCWLLHWPSCSYGPMPLSLSKSKEEILHRFICTSRWPNFLNIKYFTCRSPPDVPEVQISEDLAVNIALALRADINKALALLREIALGHNLMKFLGVYLFFFPVHWQFESLHWPNHCSNVSGDRCPLDSIRDRRALWTPEIHVHWYGFLRSKKLCFSNCLNSHSSYLNINSPNSGLDPPYGADIVPQVSGPGGRFRCKGTQGALQAVQGPGRQSSEQDSESYTKR